MKAVQAKIMELTNDESQAQRKICLNSIYSFLLCFILPRNYNFINIYYNTCEKYGQDLRKT